MLLSDSLVTPLMLQLDTPGDTTGTATCGATVLLPGYAVEDVPIGIGRTSTDDEKYVFWLAFYFSDCSMNGG